MTYSQPPVYRRRKRYRAGHRAEWLAGAYLLARGNRVLERRYRTGAGEIDLIVVKGARVAFVEVKRRATLAEAEAAITAKVRERVRRAADVWLSKNQKYQSHTLGYDVIFVLPWSVPVYLRDAL